MLYECHFTLIIDHMSLDSIFASKNGIPVYTANRLQQWATKLLIYNFSIKYLSSNKIGKADALSKLVSSHHRLQEATALAAVFVVSALVSTVKVLPVTSEMNNC